MVELDRSDEEDEGREADDEEEVLSFVDWVGTCQEHHVGRVGYWDSR